MNSMKFFADRTNPFFEQSTFFVRKWLPRTQITSNWSIRGLKRNLTLSFPIKNAIHKKLAPKDLNDYNVAVYLAINHQLTRFPS